MTVTGQNFVNIASLSCRFGAAYYTVIARYLTSRTLECVAPPHDAGQVAVQLSLNGQQFVNLGATYLYHEVPIIYAIDPPRGPVEGGTLMEVWGQYFSVHPAATVVCRVGGVTVPATVRSTSRLSA